MFFDEGMKITIREGVDCGEKSCKYTCVNPDTGNVYLVFGLVQGGDTKEEAVFWAERMASKNGLEFIRPEGWEDVIGSLPQRQEA